MSMLTKIRKNKTLTGCLLILLGWVVLHVLLRSAIVPSPYAVAVKFLHLLGGDLLLHIGASLFRIVAAVLFSVAIGTSIGLLAGLGKMADRLITPVVYVLYPVPKIALLPIFMILFGLGDASKIILIISVIVFQITLAVRDGVKEIPEEMFLSSQSLGLDHRQLITNLVLPAALPKIMSALRISVGISLSVLFFAENFATAYGIGHYIMNSWTMTDYVGMYAGIIALSILGFALFKLIDFAQKKLCPWLFLTD